MSYLYVIAEEDNPRTCKIGFSKDPHKRVKSLQTGHPNILKMYYAEEFDDHLIKKFERIIHKTLKHLKVNGEWFNLTPEQATSELIFLKIRFGDELYLDIYC